MVGDAEDRRRCAEYERNAKRIRILRERVVSGRTEYDRRAAQTEMDALLRRQFHLFA